MDIEHRDVVDSCGVLSKRKKKNFLLLKIFFFFLEGQPACVGLFRTVAVTITIIVLKLLYHIALHYALYFILISMFKLARQFDAAKVSL